MHQMWTKRLQSYLSHTRLSLLCLVKLKEEIRIVRINLYKKTMYTKIIPWFSKASQFSASNLVYLLIFLSILFSSTSTIVNSSGQVIEWKHASTQEKSHEAPKVWEPVSPFIGVVLLHNLKVCVGKEHFQEQNIFIFIWNWLLHVQNGLKTLLSSR